MNLAQAIRAAYDADDRYEAAVKASGYKSRWNQPALWLRSPALQQAYFAKVAADKAMGEAFAEMRRVAS